MADYTKSIFGQQEHARMDIIKIEKYMTEPTVSAMKDVLKAATKARAFAAIPNLESALACLVGPCAPNPEVYKAYPAIASIVEPLPPVYNRAVWALYHADSLQTDTAFGFARNCIFACIQHSKGVFNNEHRA